MPTARRRGSWGRLSTSKPGPRPEALAGEVHVVRHLVGQEPAVRRPEGELPRVEGRLDHEVLRPHVTRPPSAAPRVHAPPAPDAARRSVNPLGTGSAPAVIRTRTARGEIGADRDARRRQPFGDAAELDAVRRPLPAERPDDPEVAGLHGSSGPLHSRLPSP